VQKTKTDANVHHDWSNLCANFHFIMSKVRQSTKKYVGIGPTFIYFVKPHHKKKQ